MADTAAPAPRIVVNDSGGSVPRLGLNIPMPSSTKPPAQPSSQKTGGT
jgi:hypothetical protein